MSPVEKGSRPPERNPPGSVGGRFARAEDAECAAACRAGDREAQEELVKRYLPSVYNLLARSLGDRELAADSTQEVFLRLFREIHSFDPSRSFRPWLFTIAWNLTRDQLRRRGVRGRGERSLSSRIAGEDGPRLAEPADRRECPPSEALERKERSDLVHAALSRLPPRQRAFLILREFEGLSHEELSEISGLPLGTVKSGIHRARRDLKDAILDLQPEWRHGL
jgi:RNA polymerase sigma-70 factor, ECF subfamily